MNTGQRLMFYGIAVLLLLAAIGLALTRTWVDTGQSQVAVSSQQSSLVDQTPLQRAEQLSALAVTPAEVQYAQQALHLADNEVDITFDSALRNATEHPPAMSAALKALQAREQSRQTRADAAQQNVTDLTQQLAKAAASRKVALQQQLELAQAQLSLDQDQLADAQEDLARAGGDPRAKIQEMLQEHEQSEVHKGESGASSNAASKEFAIENTVEHNVIAQFRAWKSLNSKQRQLDSVRADALAFAATLANSHESLESRIAAQQPENSFANSGQGASAADSNTAAAISRMHALSTEQKNLAGFDKRIEDEQSLAATYAKWSALDLARERVFLRGIPRCIGQS